MKKFLIPLMATLLLAPLFSSCDKEEVIEFDSINSYFLDPVTVTSNDWSMDGPNLIYDIEWNAINNDVIEVGDVHVSINDRGILTPLPYTYTRDEGPAGFLVEQISYSYRFHHITIMIENKQGLDISHVDMPTFTFYVTAHLPVRNSIVIDD